MKVLGTLGIVAVMTVCAAAFLATAAMGARPWVEEFQEAFVFCGLVACATFVLIGGIALITRLWERKDS